MELLWRILSGIGAFSAVIVLAGWVVWRGARKGEDTGRLAFKILISLGCFAAALALMNFKDPSLAFYNIIVGLFFGLPVGLMWVPWIAEFVAKPFGDLFDGGDVEVDPEPLYSMAESKRQRSLFTEAIEAVDVQLEKFPDDFRGTLLKATIQAEDLNDFRGGSMTLETLLATGKLPAHSIASTLSVLADWQLRFANDREKAVVYLRRIVTDYPDTPMGHQAAQRIARIESGEQIVVEKFVVTPGIHNLGLRNDPPKETPDADPGELVAKWVRQLERHPTDTDTRERLAVLYAEKFQRLDLALDQLEQLIALPNETPAHVGRWLNLVATLQIRIGENPDAAEKALRRIIERFPDAASAYAATNRLACLNHELRALDKTETKTMGVYEQKLGLKKARSAA